MLEHDQSEILRVLKDHFPKATDADGSLVWDAVKGYGLDDAVRAVKEHRIEQGKIVTRPDVRRLKTLAATYYRDSRPAPTERTIWQQVCGADPFGSSNSTKKTGDLMLHFANAWELVKRECKDARGKAGARAMIMRNASMAFQQEGMSPTDAEQEARQIVELAAGEKIALPSLFHVGTNDVASVAKVAAIRQLAGAA